MRQMNSRLSRGQAIAVLLWFPVHMFVLPYMGLFGMQRGLLSDVEANLLVYTVGALFMLLVLRRFLRRDFDPLCDRPLGFLLAVVGLFLLCRFGNFLVNVLLIVFDVAASNTNNDAVISMMKADPLPSAAMTVILAPILEECLFRAGIFGLLRRKSRLLAYFGSALLFGAYHLVPQAFYQPQQWIFLLHYLPSSLCLAYAYEYNDSLWSSIFLHMLLNGVALAATLS